MLGLLKWPSPFLQMIASQGETGIMLSVTLLPTQTNPHQSTITVYNVAMFGGVHMLQLYVSAQVGGCTHASVEQGAVRYYTLRAVLYFTKYRHINKAP